MQREFFSYSLVMLRGVRLFRLGIYSTSNSQRASAARGFERAHAQKHGQSLTKHTKGPRELDKLIGINRQNGLELPTLREEYEFHGDILNQESRKWDFRDRRQNCEGSSERVGAMSEFQNRNPENEASIRVRTCCATLHERFNFTKRCRRWEWSAFRFIKLDPLVHGSAQFGIDCPFVTAVHAAQHQSWTTADVALILFAPGNHFHVTVRSFAHDFARSIARLRSRS